MLNAHHHMPVPLTGRAAEAPTQADLDFLDLLTGPVNPSARARQQESTTEQPHAHPHVKAPMRRRDQLFDPLMISAVIEGSAPMATRNHFGHEFQGKSYVCSTWYSFTDIAACSFKSSTAWILYVMR